MVVMNRTLTRGLELLMCLAGSPRPHTVSELAVQMGLPPSHVHRLLRTLVDSGHVEQDASRRYAIGVGALRLGHALLSHIPVRRDALPHMRRLAEDLGVAVTLALPFGDQAISVAHVSHDGRVRPSQETLGGVLAAHCSASGKLFLALRPPAERDEALRRLTYEPRGPRSHRSATGLRRDLIAIARRGYSVNDRENGADNFSVAVPLADARCRVISCLGVSGRPDDFAPPRLAEVIDALRECVESIRSASHTELEVTA